MQEIRRDVIGYNLTAIVRVAETRGSWEFCKFVSTPLALQLNNPYLIAFLLFHDPFLCEYLFWLAAGCTFKSRELNNER